MPELTSGAGALLMAAILGYLFGSIPFGVIVTRLLGLGDLRRIGSGNIGATNVLRTGNKPAALATLLLDGAKGVSVSFSNTALSLRFERARVSRSTWPNISVAVRS